MSVDFLELEELRHVVTPVEATDCSVITPKSCGLFFTLSDLSGKWSEIGAEGSGATAFCCFLLNLPSSSMRLSLSSSDLQLSVSLCVAGNSGGMVTSLVCSRRLPRSKCSMRSKSSLTVSWAFPSSEAAMYVLRLCVSLREDGSSAPILSLLVELDANVLGCTVKGDNGDEPRWSVLF